MKFKFFIRLRLLRFFFFLLCYLAFSGVGTQSMANAFIIEKNNNILPYDIQHKDPIRVTGRVTDASDNPLPGVTIREKGISGSGAVTDINGNYEITVPEDAILVVSFVGYKTQEVAVKGKNEIDIVLNPSVSKLNQLVVVGYGTQERKNVTGAITQVKGAKLEKSHVQSLSNAFSGRIPGVIAMNRSGVPGDDEATISIRGKSTLGNNSPLVVIDGVPGRGGLNQIDPNNIKNISILKDASAAIYGARAANGVILITTKRGAVGKPAITYSFNQGWAQPTRLPKYANSADYAEFYNYLNSLENKPPRFSKEDIEKFRDGSDPKGHPSTNWIKATLKDFSVQRAHNLSIQGGSEAVRYYLAGNFKYANSIFRNGNMSYRSWNARANVDVFPFKNDIKFTLNLSTIHTNKLRPSPSSESIFSAILRTYPFLRVHYLENGLPTAGNERGENPVVMVTDQTGYRRYKRNRYGMKLGLNVPLPIEGLSINGFLAYDRYFRTYKRWRIPWTVYTHNQVTDEFKAKVGGPVSQPDLRLEQTNPTTLTANGKLHYKNQFGNHGVDAFVALEYTRSYNTDFYAMRQYYLSSSMDELFAGSSKDQIANGSSSLLKRAQIISRISYNYKEKYLLDLIFNYSGSSNFPSDRRWGFFPGLTAGWRLSEEPFLKDVNWISDLKIRASIGQMGNDKINAHQFLATYNYATGAFFGSSLAPHSGLEPGVLPNILITWETSNSYNVGLDADLWNNLISFSFNLYKDRRSNILTASNESIPDFTGTSLPDQNIGVVENKGLEFSLSHKRTINNWSYHIGGNFSFAKNKVISIAEPANAISYQKQEGHPIGSRLLYVSTGIYKNQAEIDRSPHPPNTKVGDLILKDVDGDGKITGADQIRFDESPFPMITYGINAGLSYKNLSFSMLWQGTGKSKRYVHLNSGTIGNELEEIVKKGFRPDRPNGVYPNIATQSAGFPSTFWYFNTNFLRFKNLNISYSIPKSVFTHAGIGIEELTVYLSGVNLLDISKYDWFDPEGENIERQNYYPPNRIYNIGVIIKF